MIYPKAVPCKGMLDQVLKLTYKKKAKQCLLKLSRWRQWKKWVESWGDLVTPWPSGPWGLVLKWPEFLRQMLSLILIFFLPYWNQPKDLEAMSYISWVRSLFPLQLPQCLQRFSYSELGSFQLPNWSPRIINTGFLPKEKESSLCYLNPRSFE